MWTFKPGMLGVAIVIVSFAGSCIFGAIINLSQEDVVKEKDDYVTDITGLYATKTQDKAYIPYTPAKNINGYTSDNTSTYAVSFTKSNTGNNYPLKYESGAPITVNKVLPTDDPPITVTALNQKVAFHKLNIQYNELSSAQKSLRTSSGLLVYEGYVTYNVNEEGQIIDPQASTGSHYYLKSLSSLYTELRTEANSLGGIDPIETISFKNKGTIGTYSYTYDIAISDASTLSDSVLYYPSGIFIVPTSDDNIYQYMNTTYNYGILEQCGNGEELSFECIFREDSGVIYFDYIASGGNIQSPIYIISNGRVSDYQILYSEDIQTMFIGEQDNLWGGRLRSLHAETYGTINYSATYSYMEHVQNIDPRYGVSVRSEENVVWSNDYQNGSMDILAYLGELSRDEGVTAEIGGLDTTKEIEWQINYNDDTLPSSTLKMVHEANGSTKMWIINLLKDTTQTPAVFIPVSTEEKDLGENWIAYNIHLDFITGDVYVQPISPSGWSNFNTWESTQPLEHIGQFQNGIRENRIIDDTPQVIEEWSISSDGVVSIQIISPLSDLTNSIGIQISNTNVYMNTHGVIMIDPEVDILKWYPLNNHFKMKFTDIASFGYAININDTTYPITSDYIVVDSKKIDLSSFEIEFERIDDGDSDTTNDRFNITIASLSDGSYAKIENVEDTTLKMEGAWYFTSGYYTVGWETVKEYKWNLDGSLAYGFSGVILITMILIGILGLIGWKMLPDTLSAFDIIVLIGVEVILFIILG